MAYEMVMPYHLHMPSYFLETFTEYPVLFYVKKGSAKPNGNLPLMCCITVDAEVVTKYSKI